MYFCFITFLVVISVVHLLTISSQTQPFHNFFEFFYPTIPSNEFQRICPTRIQITSWFVSEWELFRIYVCAIIIFVVDIFYLKWNCVPFAGSKLKKVPRWLPNFLDVILSFNYPIGLLGIRFRFIYLKFLSSSPKFGRESSKLWAAGKHVNPLVLISLWSCWIVVSSNFEFKST